MSVAITCATCGLFFDDFGAFEAHQIDTCRQRRDQVDAMRQYCPRCGMGSEGVPIMQSVLHQQSGCTQFADWWRATVTVRDALFLRQIGIDPL